MEKLIFTQLSESELRQIIREELVQFFKENAPQEIENEASKIVDLDGLLIARPFIGSRSSLYKKCSAREIPHSKRGKRLIFDLKVIDDWLLENKVKTKEEIAESAMERIRSLRKKR